MKKGLILALALAAGLNAAVLATVNGENITDEDLAPLLGQQHGAEINLPAEVKKKSCR